LAPPRASSLGDDASIVFRAVGNVDRDEGSIFVIDPVGGERRQIVDEPVCEARWDPSGRRIER
jgi:hypothetical protein